MKKILITIQLVCMCLLPVTANNNDAWKQADRIVQSIRKTSFPDKTFPIVDFGAKPNDSLSLSHNAINAAIEACHKAGGGKVVIPAGVFYAGPVILKSNVNLHFETGAVLRFSTDYNLYYPGVHTRWEGMEAINAIPLIYALDAKNIAITGKGEIDGQATRERWWFMKGNARNGWKEGMISQEKGGRDRLMEYVRNEVPVEKRRMTLADGLRPQLISFYNCEQVLIEGVTLKRSPFWVIHPVYCNDLIVRDVHIDSNGPNNDGCDPESCENVLIEGCYFNTGDDCIAIKSGRNEDGRDTKPSRNIVIRNCRMQNGHGGVVIGSEISGGCENVFVENCEMDSPNLDRVIRIKTNTCRGGLIEHIYARNIRVGQCKEAVLRINLNYESNENCNRGFNPTVRKVYLDNITCGKSGSAVYISGLDDSLNISDIYVENCRFENVKKESTMKGRYQLHIEHTLINGKLVNEAYSK